MTASPQESSLRFGDFTLDLACGALFGGGVELKLRPKSFDVLCYLASRPGKLASKDELVQAIWGRANVSDESIAKCISEIRAVLRDEAGEIVTTVPRRGYRFSAQINSVLFMQAGGDVAQAPRLSIVVLPFLNLGAGPEQEHFVDGVTESLTTDLSRIRGSFVIARHTAFTYKGKSADVKQIGRELNVRYVLEGSVQRSANRMRVNVQLIEAATGSHLWADRFDKPVADLFYMQDEIVSRLAGSLKAQFIAAEARRAERVASPDAMDLCFQGSYCMNNGGSHENIERAREFFDRARAIEPDNISALIGSAAVDHYIGAQVMVAEPAKALASAELKLNRLLTLVPDNPQGHARLGLIYIITKRSAQGIAECEYALALDPNLAPARAGIGLGKMYIDRPEEVEAHVLEALRLSPRDPFAGSWMIYAGLAKGVLRLPLEAAAWFRRAIDANRNFAYSHFVWGAALVQLGRLDEARAFIKTGLALNPAFSLSRARAAFGAMSDNAAHQANLEAGLQAWRIAGVPE